MHDTADNPIVEYRAQGPGEAAGLALAVNRQRVNQAVGRDQIRIVKTAPVAVALQGGLDIIPVRQAVPDKICTGIVDHFPPGIGQEQPVNSQFTGGGGNKFIQKLHLLLPGGIAGIAAGLLENAHALIDLPGSGEHPGFFFDSVEVILQLRIGHIGNHAQAVENQKIDNGTETDIAQDAYYEKGDHPHHQQQNG